ncbi:MAG TPA: MFS transporter [Candidatus Eisenbacteria bacterium]|nr:MFS transporter [Candidatus Eisenbacteria bacterium]
MSRIFSGLTRNTYLLALASLFADISTEMLYPVLPVFLTERLGAPATILGLIEGVAQAVQNIVQGFSGWLADHLGRRKPVALAGYLLAACSKPFIGLSTHWSGALTARSLDRLGAGSRSAPRDALVAASVAERDRGRAFGLEGIGDNLGAFLGPLITLGLIGSMAVDIKAIFLLAFIPGILAAIMVLFVRERPVAARSKVHMDGGVHSFPRAYWTYLGVMLLFGLGNSSNAFLILRARDLGLSLTATILVYAFFNLVAAVASYPSGYLSDRVGRKWVLVAALLVFTLVYAGFGFAQNPALIGALFVLYGLYQGIFRTVGKALATDFLPSELRASGIGWYSTAIGLSGLAASLIAGALWTRAGPAAPFIYGALLAGLGTLALVWLVPNRRTRASSP